MHLSGYSCSESQFGVHPGWGWLEQCELAEARSTEFSKVPQSTRNLETVARCPGFCQCLAHSHLGEDVGEEELGISQGPEQDLPWLSSTSKQCQAF